MERLRSVTERFLAGAFRTRVTDGIAGSPTTEETERLIAILQKRMMEP